jgi:hypothetical protein
MSDFLTRLINRHIGLEEQVQPRVRSRFEPVSAAAFLSPEDEGYSSPLSSSTVDGNTRAYPFPGPHDGDLHLGTGEDTRNFFQGNRGIRNTEGIFEPAASISSPAGDPGEYKKQAGPHNGYPDESRDEPIRAGVLNHVIPVVTIKTQGDTPDRQSRQRPPAAGEPSPWPGIPGEDTELGPVMGTPAVFTPLRDTGPEVKGLLEAPAWVTEQPKEVHNRLFLNGSKPGGEPVVHVTIGRIEVRATRPPAPEPPRHQEKPSGIMTLEKYLSQCK